MPIVPQTGTAEPATGGVVPFQIGSFQYTEQIAIDTLALGAGAVEFVHNITPGGFLRGVDLYATSSGGTTGTLAADAPYSLFSSVSLENIDGSPILYPMNGYAYAMWQKFSMPWLGEPANPAQGYNAAMATPGWTLHMYPEIYGTAGCLANTDARAQYRVRYTLAPVTQVGTGYTVNPTVTVTSQLQSWAQPDRQDLHGNTIENVPPGLNLARIVRHQIVPLNPAGADNLIQLTNTGNEIRNIILIVRDQTNARADALSSPIRIRLDDRSLGVYTVQSLFDRAAQFYPTLANNTFPRPTGVYVIPRFKSTTPEGDLMGSGNFWLPTSNATYLTIESTTATGPTGGTVEIITDEVVPVGSLPSQLEGI